MKHWFQNEKQAYFTCREEFPEESSAEPFLVEYLTNADVLIERYLTKLTFSFLKFVTFLSIPSEFFNAV